MKIVTKDGEDLLEFWHGNRSTLQAEIIGGHVALTFTGNLARYNTVEIVLARGSDELSISTFCGSYRVLPAPAQAEPAGFWQRYRRGVQIDTDGGAQCTIFELCDDPATKRPTGR